MKRNTNYFILNTMKLPILTSLDDLVREMRVSRSLIYLLSQKTGGYYKTVYISKKNGGQRELNKPSYSLKLIQRWILEEILEKISVSKEAKAFLKGLGIKENAEVHKYSLYILELDIKNFFPSVAKEKVFYLFRKLGYNHLISNILTNLCTLQGTLPQGAVTSPYLSNLILYDIDMKIAKISEKKDVVFSRYADDLTFSGNDKLELRKIEGIVKKMLSKEGFELNLKKTRYLAPGKKKSVTGITITHNNLLKADKKIKKKVRGMIFRAISTGDYKDIERIKGYISYIDSIEKNYKKKLKEYITSLSLRTIYNEFLVESYNTNKIFKDLNSIEYSRDLEVYLDYDKFEFELEKNKAFYIWDEEV